MIKFTFIVYKNRRKIDGVQPKVMPTGFSFEAYQTLEEINDWLDETIAANSDVAELIIAGTSYEGREIRGIKISYKEVTEKIPTENLKLNYINFREIQVFLLNLVSMLVNGLHQQQQHM